jgi:hypothetical protein
MSSALPVVDPGSGERGYPQALHINSRSISKMFSNIQNLMVNFKDFLQIRICT